MNISPSDLLNEWARSSVQWQTIAECNELYGLPPYLLHAVGSRETNLTNERGDNGHGHGIFQLDDRSHIIPDGFDNDIGMQCVAAAEMLAGLFARFSDWTAACNAYNSGSPNSADTTGGDYGPDVMSRQSFLLKQLGVPVNDPVWDKQIIDHYQDNTTHHGATMPASELLSWAPTHAAHALDEIRALRAELPALIAAAVQGAVITVEIQQGKTTPQ